jgi:putative hydrolase of the HAD superfamily
MRPQVLLVDLDETLLDGSFMRESIERTCRSVAAQVAGLDAISLLAANDEIWPSYSAEVVEEWELGRLDSMSLRLGAWRRTLRVCGCDDEGVALLAVETHVEFARTAHRLFDDAEELFVAAQDNGVRLGLVTNGASDVQREKLRVLGIEHWFDVLVVSGEVGVAKPDASVFQIALYQLRVRPESAWHVGDSLRADVGGARAAGVIAVWLNRNGGIRGEGDPLPDLEVPSLRDLAQLLSARGREDAP